MAQVGQVIAGKFRVERVLGEGGMGLVVEATHLLLDQRVALKFLRPQVMLQADIVARFAQEARAAAMLKSEHVARVLDVGEERSVPYIVMEYLEGKNLEEQLAADGPFSVTDAVELLIQAAEGISEAHARGIVHRDLKPANLFLAQRSDAWATLKILDFGISKAALTTSPSNVAAGPGKTMSLLGSPYYMSPEQLRSTRDVDRRTDLWSLGVVLFELVGGETPFNATEFLPLVNQILEEPHTSLRSLRPDAPEALEALIDRALAKDPADRFQSAGELALALLPFTTSKRSRVIATHAITLTRSSGIDPSLPLPSGAPPPMTGSVKPSSVSSAPLRSVSGISGKRRIDSSAPTHPSMEVPIIAQAARPTELGPTSGSRARTPLVAFAVVGLLLVAGATFFATRGSRAATPPPVAAAETARTAIAASAPPQPAPSAEPPLMVATAVPTQPVEAVAKPIATAAPRPAAFAAPIASAKHPTAAPSASAPPPGGGLEIRRER